MGRVIERVVIDHGSAADRAGAQRARDGGRPIRRASITNLGCKVNQAEVDQVARLLSARGVRLVADGAQVDLHVVNTCSVTSIADDKSRKAARRARRSSPDGLLIVTGCSVAVSPAGYGADDPRALLMDNAAKDRLVAEVDRLTAAPGRRPDRHRSWTGGRGRDAVARMPDAVAPGSSAVLAGPLPTLAGVAMEGTAADAPRVERTRAFIKVQDGCSFHCTYCIIPRARGAERSVLPVAVLADVRRALAAGHREIVLTGINIGTYDGGWSEPGPRGTHRRSALTLAGLVRRILAETDVERIRLSSIEPQHVDDDLLDVWVTDGAGRCLPHFHLPLQSGDDGVLRRMGRRYDSAFYAGVVGRIRASVPGAAVHADVIVGFPTEDDAAWDRSLAFIGRLDLAGIHVFRYSERPATPAMRMAGEVPEPTRRARAAVLLGLAAVANHDFAVRAVGAERRVLFEQHDPAGGWTGHAEDHVLVRSMAADAADGDSLAGLLARVGVVAIDTADPARVIGRVIEHIPPRPATLPGTRARPGRPPRVGTAAGIASMSVPSSGGPA